MWFRNLTLFRFSESTARSLKSLESKLEPWRLRPCGPQERSRVGFVSPYGRGEEGLVHQVGDYALASFGREERLLPNAVVKDEIAARLKKFSEKERKKWGAKQRQRLRDEVIAELLPRAFVRTSYVSVYFAKKSGWLVVDTARRKLAEEVVSQLRRALGTFPALPLTPEESPRALMTDWLIRGKLPAGLAWGDECELRDPVEAGAIVRCRRQDLETDEVREHLKSGKQVFQLGLVFEDRIGFVLGEDLAVRKLTFLDAVRNELGDTPPESARSELDARFALMTLELERLLHQLEQGFGLPRPTERT